MNIFSTVWNYSRSIAANLSYSTAAPRANTDAAAFKIQRWFRQNRTSIALLDDALTCLLASRVYLIHYPTDHLVRFPDFVAQKARPDLKTWIDSNIPPPEMRTRRDVRNFFVNSGVKYEDVVHAGW